MKQAIAGVVPETMGEVTVMTVWPTIAAGQVGQALGKLYSIRSGVGNILTVGNLIALATIPLALALFFWGLFPGVCRRYRLTNRRVIVQKGLQGVDERWISLDDFDSIEVKVLPGQDWYPAGELIFRKGQLETFRLSGVSRPETFRQTCLKSHQAHASVQQALSRQPVLT